MTPQNIKPGQGGYTHGAVISNREKKQDDPRLVKTAKTFLLRIAQVKKAGKPALH